MDNTRLCSDCFLLLQRQLINMHDNLIERNHVYNDTVYECKACHCLIRLSHVPHQWSVIEETAVQSENKKTA